MMAKARSLLVLLCSLHAMCDETHQRSMYTNVVDFVCSPGNATSLWGAKTDRAAWFGRSDMAVAVKDNHVWVMGGQRGASGAFELMNDVWKSADGAAWTSVTGKAPWAARRKFGGLTFNSKLWAMGGTLSAVESNERHTSNAVWSSADGVTWQAVREDSASCTGSTCDPSSSSYMWAPRHSMVAVDFLGKIWIISGVRSDYDQYAAANQDFIHDIWFTDNGVRWTRAANSTPWQDCRSVVGAVHRLQLFIMAESRELRYYYTTWISSDGVTFKEARQACAVSGQPVGGLVSAGGSLMVFAVSDRLLGDQEVLLWYTNSTTAEDAIFYATNSSVANGPRRGAGYTTFAGEVWQIGGSCLNCGMSTVMNVRRRTAGRRERGGMNERREPQSWI
ncbi:hypothetical protein GUITHDRAFT_111064 [Guillardia theta CCMP2712]|uniref:Uncharacterized protein n=1 Tax=Guillardia theta (strain CCMP2712) TaxID=905079 RepID=L1J3W4_GUITC|nr:hypothetical protein GUITHDRAFT_111064 [Guillardia theta CCMP2712]EKX43022.1 hypothetical protein GUITHDRAFT_111064 [Guillardia theta CCMP2712]|eukprot:XP_005830002.1 hypothetical protein GUITHDRAFT_111064 [Guillardia theta CCMP2712]